MTCTFLLGLRKRAAGRLAEGVISEAGCELRGCLCAVTYLCCVQTDLFTWNDYYWASNVLLAEVTDGGTFHQQAQHFMQQWICGFGKLVAYTAKGRAYNSNDGTLAATQNAVFLAARYAKYIQPSNGKKSTKYLCWARAQVRLPGPNHALLEQESPKALERT